MECGKLTAKLRDAVPVCFIENGKEVKRFKNIEIPDEIKKLPYQDFEFSVPVTGAITFKIMFEEGVLPKVWPEARTRKSRKVARKKRPSRRKSQPGFRRHWCRRRPRASLWQRSPKQPRRARRSLPS